MVENSDHLNKRGEYRKTLRVGKSNRIIMKYKITLTLIFILTISLNLNAQFSFGVSSGFQRNGGSFGYKYKKFVPQIGLQLFHAGFTIDENGLKNDTGTSKIIPYNSQIKASATVFMPSLGLKYFFLESGKLKAYGIGSYSKVILSVKAEDSEDPTINDDVQKEIKNIRISGWQLGFGTEYFFDENFSIGGEFGLMGLTIKNKTERERILFDPNTGDDVITTIKQNLKLNINPTYARMTLNFYF